MNSIEIDKKHIQNQLMLRAVCHDLANSLSIVMTAASQFRLDPSLTPERRLILIDKICQAAEVQKRVIMNLKPLSTFVSADTEPALGVVDLAEAVAEIRLLFSEVLAERGITITFSADSEKAAAFLGDYPSFLYLVLNNLVSNAIKYSQDNATIEIKSGLENDEVHLVISDQGSGIKKSTLSNIFSFKHKAIEAGTKGEFGAGLGLPLVKFCLDRTQSRIEIQSTTRNEDPERHGTAVHLYLPKAHS